MENLVELKSNELQQVNGGIAWWIPVAVGAILADWEEFKKGFSEGTEGF